MGSAHTLPERPDQNAGDKAGQEFWDKWWQGPLPEPIDPHRPGLKNYPLRQFHSYFEKVFKGHPTDGKKLVEIGCAQSVFLPYFSKCFGFEVSGLDRSEIGCERARAILERENVNGRIYCGDLLSPPREFAEQFDVVVSFGVVEHFEKTAECLKAMATVLKHGGEMITSIPSLVGINGTLQKILDRCIYDVHVPLDREALAAAHRLAGLEVKSCEYFLPISLEVVNVENWGKGPAYWVAIRTHGAVSRAVWFVDGLFPILRPNRWTSPYINCVARRPTA